jgi:hypothetical protein
MPKLNPIARQFLLVDAGLHLLLDSVCVSVFFLVSKIYLLTYIMSSYVKIILGHVTE